MPAYLLLLLAIASRLIPHPWHFTAVGGSLLYFGARRSWKQAAIPVALLALTDFYLTTRVYGLAFHVQEYALTWVWYAAVIVLGGILLAQRTSVLRVASGAVLASGTFFLASNFAVWQGSGMYPHTASGLYACYVAGLPFYRNDLLSTAVVAGLAFGVPALVRRLSGHSTAAAGRIAA